MITKVDIASFGVFKDYQWRSEIGNADTFKNLNIIFGRNYSGKTTFSRIFRSVETRTKHKECSDGEFICTRQDGSTIKHSEIHNVPESLKVRVFNEDFVKENLGWLHRPDGTIEPFTVLGEENVELGKKIAGIDAELGVENDNTTVLGKLSEVTKESTETTDLLLSRQTALEGQLTNKARTIKEDATTFAVPNYNRPTIAKDLSEITDEHRLPSDKQAELRSLLRENPLPEIAALPSLSLNFPRILDQSKQLLERDVVPTQQIAELLADSDLQGWVRSGIELHRNKKNNCGFCGGKIPPNLWERLDAHFSKESEELRSQISSQIVAISHEASSIENYLRIGRESFYSGNKQQFDLIVSAWNAAAKEYISSLEQLSTKLAERERDIFKKGEFGTIDDKSSDLRQIQEQLSELIRANNDRTSSLEVDQKKAREALRLAEVAEFGATIDYDGQISEIKLLQEKVEDLTKRKRELEEQKAKLLLEKRSLENQTKDESHGAELINRYLQKHFGHSHLQLAASKESGISKFSVIRGNREATNLSTGECSLIAFCYFIARIKDEIADDLIVIIDDPISSLDNNHIFFVFSLIKSKLWGSTKCKQLFISTHNLDFLRYIKNLVPNREQDKVGYYLIVRTQRQNEPRSFLKKMPPHLRKYVTEFSYLFSQIYEIYQSSEEEAKTEIAATYNQFYNLPNNLRKFLEYYLFFRFPNSDNLEINLRRVFEESDFSRINRVINEGSHLKYVDRGWQPFDVPEVKRCVDIVLDKIKEIDQDQFAALVESIS